MKNLFEMDLKYHYYEDKVYDMGTYHAGFNLRQLKRIMSVLGGVSSAYTGFYKLMENKGNRKETSKNEEALLKLHKSIAERVYLIVEDLGKFKNTSPINYSRIEDTFARQYEKEMSGRRWVRMIHELEGQKYVRYNENHEKEEYAPDDSYHIASINSGLGTYAIWGNWLGYLKEGLFEGDTDATDGSESFDIGRLMEVMEDSQKLLEGMNKLDYVKELFL